MAKKLVFDTLNYAKMLENAGIECADIHSMALAEAMVQNHYTKNEVEKMFDESLKRFDERTHQIQLEMKAIKKAMNHNLYATVSILGGLIVIVGVIATFTHAFFH